MKDVERTLELHLRRVWILNPDSLAAGWRKWTSDAGVPAPRWATGLLNLKAVKTGSSPKPDGLICTPGSIRWVDSYTCYSRFDACLITQMSSQYGASAAGAPSSVGCLMSRYIIIQNIKTCDLHFTKRLLIEMFQLTDIRILVMVTITLSPAVNLPV